MEPEKQENPQSVSDQKQYSWTFEEQAAFIAKFKADYDPVAEEAELTDLLKQRERGELVSFEEVLRDLGIDVEDDKETA